MTDWPITLQDAAKRIHASERWLRDHLKAHPCGRKAGRRIVFTESDFNDLIGSLTLLSELRGARPKNTNAKVPPSAESQSEKAIKLAQEGMERAKRRDKRKQSRSFNAV